MRIHVITIGNKVPGWIEDGYREYAKRMPPECRLTLVELPPSPRSKNSDLERALHDEGARMLKAIPKNARVLALDGKGKQHSTESLARTLATWLSSGQDVALLVGGADGLAAECLAAAQGTWSLSELTFPHPLVRVLLAEQLYRAWSLLNNHPYHRG